MSQEEEQYFRVTKFLQNQIRLVLGSPNYFNSTPIVDQGNLASPIATNREKLAQGQDTGSQDHAAAEGAHDSLCPS